MTVPPTYNLHDLGPQAQMMAKNCNNERLAMILQYVAIGSMIVMAGAAASPRLERRVRAYRTSRQVKMTRARSIPAPPARSGLQGKRSSAIVPAGRQPRRDSRAEGREPGLPDGS